MNLLGTPLNKKNIFGYLFLPQIGPRLNSFFNEGFASITYVVALILSAVKLLDKNHAALSAKGSKKYSAIQILGEASRNLKYDRGHIDQVIIFFALIAGIILLALQFIFILLFMMNGSAFAQELPQSYGDFIEVTGNTEDIAMQMMAYVFGMPNFFGVEGLVVENAFHQGLRGIFQFYSIGLLVIATLLVIYFIFAILAETAQTGTPFGKRYNHVWAPIRLVVAIGLLVPIGQGLNSGQWITLHAAKYGSGFATNGWNKFNETINEAYIPSDEVLARPNIQARNYKDMAAFFMIAHACKKIYQESKVSFANDIDAYLVKERDGQTPVTLNGTNYFDAIKFKGKEDSIRIVVGHKDAKYRTEVGNVKPHCGILSLITSKEEVTQTSGPGGGLDLEGIDQISYAHFKIIEDMWAATGVYRGLQTEAEAMVEARLSPAEAGAIHTSNPEIRVTVIKDAQDRIEKSVDRAINDLKRSDATPLGDEFLKYGWGGAGLWYNSIAKVNGALVDAAMEKPQIVQPPQIMKYVCEENRQQNKNTSANKCYDPDLTGKLPIQSAKNVTRSAMKALSDIYDFWYVENETRSNNIFIDTINLIFGTTSLFDMCKAENAKAHPLAQLSVLGKELVDVSIRNFAIGIFGGLGSNFAGHFGPALAAASSFASTIASTTILLGFILYYIVPFLPFLYFFFAVGGWVKGIFEAMVGVPLWALAHIRIDGEGLPGDAATNGYYLIFEIFIRPILIIFGLVASLLIFSAMVKTLNGIFDVVVANLSGFSGELSLCGSEISAGGGAAPENTLDSFRGPVDAFFFTIVYAIIVYILGMSSFKLIDLIPNQILRWMGNTTPTFNDSSEEPGKELVSKIAIGGTLLSQFSGGVGSNFTKAVKEAGTGAKKGLVG